MCLYNIVPLSSISAYLNFFCISHFLKYKTNCLLPTVICFSQEGIQIGHPKLKLFFQSKVFNLKVQSDVHKKVINLN